MSTDFDNIENMSDEDFINLELPDFISEQSDSAMDDEDLEGAEAPEELESEDEVSEETDEADEDDLATEGEEESDGSEAEEEETAESSDDEQEEDSTDEAEETDDKKPDDLAELFKPFKANNREMSVNSIEEARTLMKMGANYNKKMAAIKPLTRVGHMLEQNGLMDEEKLSFLIDVHNKNPQAVAKFLKDSGIDPLDVDTETGSEYTPKSHAPSDAEMNLDEVLREMSETETYQKTIDTVTKDWDKISSEALATNPQDLLYLNEQMGNGVFDMITDEVDRQRTFGGLRGVNDYEAYKKVGAEMLAKANANQQGQQATPNSESTQSKSKPVNKKKVAIPKKKASGKNNNDFLDLDKVSRMSDEEFEKHFDSKFR